MTGEPKSPPDTGPVIPEKERREAPLYHAVVVVLVVTINALLIKISWKIGVLLIPLSGYAVAFLLVRLIAPRFLRSRILKYLDKHGGEARTTEVIEAMAMDVNAEKMEPNREIVRRILSEMQDQGIIHMTEHKIRRIKY